MLKNKAALTLLCLLLGQFVNAQQKEFIPEWNVGVGAGVNFSTLRIVRNKSSEAINNKNIQGLQAGVAVRYITEKHLGIVGELNYTKQGWEENFEADSNSKYIRHLNYLQIPILTQIYFGEKMRFFVNLGPQLSLLLSESEKVENLTKTGSTDKDGEVIENQYGRKAQNKLDYGIVAGLGMELRTSMGNFSVEGRYSFGLGDIFKSSVAEPFSRSANRVLSAKITYYTKLF